MTVQQIQDYVYNFLINKGLPHITACAIMGNIQGENASWDVSAEETGSGIGLGLCQWSYARRTQLEAYGTTLDHQLNFLWSELTGENTSSTGAEYQWISNPADSVDNGEGFECSNADFLSGNGTIEFLTKAFCYCWERPAYSTNHLDSIRIPYAKTFYDYYEGITTNAKIIDDAVAWAVSIANDDIHGYDQTSRWGNDYDCSSLLIQAYENAGCKVKTAGATYTGDMEKAFVSCGFESLEYTSGMTLLKGDVLLRDGHTEMYIGNGQNVGAHINELGTVTGGQTGDQTGHEISITDFASSGSWVTVLRLPSSGSTTPDTPNPPAPGYPTIERKKMSKLLLYAIGSDIF